MVERRPGVEAVWQEGLVGKMEVGTGQEESRTYSVSHMVIVKRCRASGGKNRG